MRILQENFFSNHSIPQSSTRINSKEQWELFTEKFRTAVDEVDGLEKESQKLTQDLVLGRVENIQDVMIAAEKARTAMNLTLEVRAKAIESYKEIMRMQF